MLKTCPECEHLVSEKAYTCPNCGYPLLEEKYKSPRQKQRSHRRLPNGFGQITKISGRNLKNPYRAMVTVGKDDSGRPICKLLRPNAYFATYNDAYAALAEYNRDPYDLSTQITMDELFKTWSASHKTENPRSIKNIKYAWAYCEQLYNKPVQSIRGRHIRALFDSPYKTVNDEKIYASPSTMVVLKSTMNQLCAYAVERDLMQRNYAKDVNITNSHQEKHHKSFSEVEMEILWALSEGDKYAKIIIMQCYMGWRPSEILSIKRENINLTEMTITGGSKTNAGKNRIVPIHSKVQNIVLEFLAESDGSEWLFPSPVKMDQHIVYNTYSKFFENIMKHDGFESGHLPHDCRKQFVTMAKNANVDEYALKRIIGHAITDMTEEVYTDRPIKWLREEIEKIK